MYFCKKSYGLYGGFGDLVDTFGKLCGCLIGLFFW
jgi:hypothetical protein